MRTEALSLKQLQALPVHPMAARFPMWPKDRLAELASDIEANGQHIPIVLWHSPDPETGELIVTLLDGRNRLAACAIARVEPRVEFFEGDDPRSLIISRNIQTREMTASQKAILLAMEYPEPKRGEHSELTKSTGEVGFDKALLSRARTIVAWAPEQAGGVASGTIKLAEALKVATEAKQRAVSREARIANLREADPELARKVVEDELTLEGAEAESRQRQAEASARRDDGKNAAERVRRLPSDVITIATAISAGAVGLVTEDLLSSVREAADRLSELLLQSESGDPYEQA